MVDMYFMIFHWFLYICAIHLVVWNRRLFCYVLIIACLISYILTSVNADVYHCCVFCLLILVASSLFPWTVNLVMLKICLILLLHIPYVIVYVLLCFLQEIFLPLTSGLDSCLYAYSNLSSVKSKCKKYQTIFS